MTIAMQLCYYDMTTSLQVTNT